MKPTTYPTRRLLTTLGAAGLAASLTALPAAGQTATDRQRTDAQKTQQQQNTQQQKDWSDQQNKDWSEQRSSADAADQSQADGFIVVRRVYALELADAPGDSMDQAQQQLKRGNHDGAADSLKRAATFLKIEADNTDDPSDRQALMKSANELEKTAQKVRDGQAKPDQVNRSLADASRSLSNARYDRGSQAWDKAKKQDAQNSSDRNAASRSSATTRSSMAGQSQDNAENDVEQAEWDFESAANFRERAARYEQDASDSDAELAQQDQEYTRELRLIAGRMKSVRTPADPQERQAAADEIDRERQRFDQRYRNSDQPYTTGAYRDDSRSTTVQTDRNASGTDRDADRLTDDKIDDDSDRSKSDVKGTRHDESM